MQTDAALPVEAIARKPLVGIDEHRHRHRFDRHRDTVFVLDADDQHLKHIERLQPGQLPDWVDYVADERGWADCRYTDGGPFESLGRQLATGLEAQR